MTHNGSDIRDSELKFSSVKTKLIEAGIVLNESTSPAPLETPWFVRVIQAFSGWLAALFLLGFIAMGVVFVLESLAASLLLGLVMIGAAYGLLRRANSDVLEHMALVISLAGQLVVAWAAVEFWYESAYLFWSLLGLQVLLALLMPSSVHRTFSAFAACLALYMALAMSAMAIVANGVILLALTLLWLNEFRWSGRIRDVQAWGYGLLIGLLVMQGLADSDQSFIFWFGTDSSNAFAWSVPWMNAVLAALSLALLLYTRFHNTKFYNTRFHSKLPWALYLSPVALLLISFYAPGVGQGLVIVLLGFAMGHRLVVGLGILSLMIGIGSYYYGLNATLLTKALTLLLIGGGLLALRWMLRRWLGNSVTQTSAGSLDNEA